jgi:hippurate hydrolase
MPIRSELVELADEMQRWRRYLHANPETAYEERNTAEFIAALLDEWGVEVHRGLAATGVVGSLRCGAGRRSIGLRAEMDALKLDECNVFDYRSRVPGKMHACGHDGHVAMLLGSAKHLARTRRFEGTIHFIFQPAEENEAGGRRMIEEGVFTRFPVDAVYGMHNMPFIPEGKFVVRPGPIMASADFFEINVIGKGAHGGWPHMGIDTIAIASNMVLGFNHIAARTVDPLDSVVISVTKFNAGHTTNVLPATATLAGTTRAFNVATQDHIEARMRKVCEGIASAHGAEVVFKYERRYPPTINHPDEAAFAAQVAARVVGVDNVLREEPAVMGAEDFGWMLLAQRGCYVWIGNGPEHQGGSMLHNPGYDFNDRILATGASFWVELAESWLSTT